MYGIAHWIFLLNCFLVIQFGTSVKNRSIITDKIDFPVDTADVAALHGYGSEIHYVKTYDGYTVGIHRIINNNDDFIQKKGVVLLMHGIFCSSSSWLLGGVDKSLPYILSNEGYDVWMGNFRGNKYSLEHESLSINSSKYWDFSWHEMGVYDLPAMIAYIKYRTGVEKVFYVAHSQGTTAYFVMSSLYPQFAKENVHAAVAMAPVAYLNNIQSRGFRLLSNFVHRFVFNSVRDFLALHNMGSPYEIFQNVMDYICDFHNRLSHLCDNLLFFISGYDQEQMDEDLIPIIWNHVPEGGSMKQVMHYSQLIKSKRFEMYDYGMIQNLYYYYSIWPPEYDLAKSEVEVALFYGMKDWISTPKDVALLEAALPNARMFQIGYENFTHIDFLWANDVKQFVYDDVLFYLNMFSDKRT